MLREARLGRKILVDHLAAFGIHHRRVGRARLQNFQRQSGVDATRFGERQALGQNGAIQTQNEVENQFHSRATAARAGVECALGERRKQFLAGFEGLRRAADENQSLGRADLLTGSSDRGVEVFNPAPGQPGTERADLAGISRGGIDDDRFRDDRFRREVILDFAEQFINGIGGWKAEQDSVALPRNGDDGVGGRAPQAFEIGAAIRVNVESRDTVSGCQKALGQRGAEKSETDETDCPRSHDEYLAMPSQLEESHHSTAVLVKAV